jgi:hypothetical protein
METGLALSTQGNRADGWLKRVHQKQGWPVRQKLRKNALRTTRISGSVVNIEAAQQNNKYIHLVDNIGGARKNQGGKSTPQKF